MAAAKKPKATKGNARRRASENEGLRQAAQGGADATVSQLKALSPVKVGASKQARHATRTACEFSAGVKVSRAKAGRSCQSDAERGGKGKRDIPAVRKCRKKLDGSLYLVEAVIAERSRVQGVSPVCLSRVSLLCVSLVCSPPLPLPPCPVRASPFASAPHNHHLAPRVSLTLRSVWWNGALHHSFEYRLRQAYWSRPDRTTHSSEPSRFSAWESVFRLRSITSATLVHRGAAMGAVRPCSGPCAAPGRPPRGQSGHRASRPNPAGRPWAHGGASTVRTELRGRPARKVNVCVPYTHATSLSRHATMG